MTGEWVLGQTAWFGPQLCPSLVLGLFTGCFVCKMGVKLICAVVQILYSFRCCPCSGLFLYQHQTVMFIVTDGFSPVHPHLKCFVDVRIKLAVAHFVRLEKPLMACVYNCRPYWLIHYPENLSLLLWSLIFPIRIEPVAAVESFLMMWEMDRYMDGHCIWKSETVPPLLSVPTALWVLILSGTQVSLRALVTGNTFSWAGLCSCALGYGAVFGSACCFSELYQALWHTHLPGPTTKSKENTQACPVARLRVRLCPEHIGEKLLRVWRWGSWRTVGLLKTCSRAMSPALSLALKKDSKFCEHHLVRIVLNSLWIWCWRGEGRIWLEHLRWRWLVSSIGCHIAACVILGEKGSLGLLSLVVCTVSSRDVYLLGCSPWL